MAAIPEAPAKTIEVSGTVVSLADFSFTDEEIAASEIAYVTPKGGAVLYMVNGEDPTANHCHIFPDSVTSQINHRAKTLRMVQASTATQVTVELAPNIWPR